VLVTALDAGSGSGRTRITGSPSRTWPSRTTQAFSAKPAAESAANIAKDLGIALVEESAIQRDAFRYRCVISNDMSPRVYEFCCNGWLYPAAFSASNRCERLFLARRCILG
jgi:hypothetical protein